jgi:hypothetical protein
MRSVNDRWMYINQNSLGVNKELDETIENSRKVGYRLSYIGMGDWESGDDRTGIDYGGDKLGTSSKGKCRARNKFDRALNREIADLISNSPQEAESILDAMEEIVSGQ